MDIYIEADGTVQAIYDDDLLDLLARVGTDERTMRVSHVEPHPTLGGWTADMRPVGGPVLFAGGTSDAPECEDHDPFETRAAALAAEQAWLGRFMDRRKIDIR